MMRIGTVIVAMFFGTALVAGCVVYEPVPVHAPTTMDRAWSAALGAMQDAGVRVTSADQGSGIIRGDKDGVDVAVSVVRQPDGRTRVQFDTKGASGRDPGLAERLSAAYERRMGR